MNFKTCSSKFILCNFNSRSAALLAKTMQNKSYYSLIIHWFHGSLYHKYSFGSQIHQNSILLHSFGLPIVKLDGLYRGVLSIRDVEEIANQLLEAERSFFLYQMYSRPFGVDTLVGWRRAAFNLGLIWWQISMKTNTSLFTQMLPQL